MSTASTSQVILLTIVVSLLIAAAIIDLRSHRIPNLLTLPSMLLALCYYSISNGMDGFLFSLIGLCTGIGLLIAPYLMGGMGAGDAKLMGMVGAFVGAKGAFVAFLLTAAVGGIYALCILLVKRHQFKGFLKDKSETLIALLLTGQYVADATSKKKLRPRLCYGLPIALGSVAYIALSLTGYTFPI